MRLWGRRRPRRLAKGQRARRAPTPHTTTRAVLEFGGSGARAALVRLLDDAADVLASGYASGQAGVARPGLAARHERLAQLAERALTSAEHQAAGIEVLPVIADEAIVGLSGPMLLAQLTTMHLPRGKPAEPVGELELTTALERAQRRGLRELAERAAAVRIRHRVVSSQLVGMVVDGERLRAPRKGRDVRAPGGPTGAILSVAICNVAWPVAGLEAIERVLAALELEGRGFVPLAQAVAAASPLPDTILIDVGHEYTEVALAEGGVLSHFRTFPLGGTHFTEALTRRLHLSVKAAELAKQRYSQGQGAPDARAMIGAVLAPLAGEWRAGLEQTLLHLAGKAPLPPHILLYGGASVVPDILAELRGQPWMRRLPFERHPEVEILHPRRLRGVKDSAGRLQGSGSVGLAALGAWAAREPSEVDRLLADISLRVAGEVGLL